MISVGNTELPICILKNPQTPFCISVLRSSCFSPKYTFLKLTERVSVIYTALFLCVQLLTGGITPQKSNLSGTGHL